MFVATRYATHQEVELKYLKLRLRNGASFCTRYMMDTGCFYYLNDQYFTDFPDPFLMRNKDTVNGQPHDRPCFYAFQDSATGLFWMIPFSHDVNKYRYHYNKKVQKYGKCDTIDFGYVLGHEKAFLIQNMCPVTQSYIKNMYIDRRSSLPVRIDGMFEKRLIGKAKKVLALQRKGVKLIIPDVLRIEASLLGQ